MILQTGNNAYMRNENVRTIKMTQATEADTYFMFLGECACVFPLLLIDVAINVSVIAVPMANKRSLYSTSLGSQRY